MYRAFPVKCVCSEWYKFIDTKNGQGPGVHTYLEPSSVEYDWQFRITDYRFILKHLVTYTITNSNGLLFGSGTFNVTEDTNTSLIMSLLMISCFEELNVRNA